MTRFSPTRSDAPPSFAFRLRATNTEHERELAALRAELEACAPAERATVQRRIEIEKLDWESRLLDLQLERARVDGRFDEAAKLETRLARTRAARRHAAAGAGEVR